MTYDGDLIALMERIFSTVFPLVAIVTLGFLYARRVSSDMAVANRINIDIFTPALIFSVMASNSFDILSYTDLVLGAFLIVIGSGLIVWPLCRILGVQPRTFAPPMMFNNCGNLGLPLALLAFGETGLAAAVAMFLVSNLMHFTLGTRIVNDQARLTHLLTNPMILATAAGLAWSLSGLTLASWIKTPIDMLGQIAIPLMLFSLGVRMTSVDFSNWKFGLYGSILSPLTGLLVAIPYALVMDLSPEFTAYLVLFSALPPAVLNFMVAERYQQEPQIVASVVLLGNISSLAVIPLVLFFIL